MALAHLRSAGLDWEPDLLPVMNLCAEERTVLAAQLAHRLNTPLTSSMGRLFDAAAALIGVREIINYEGQAAIEMEAMADPHENGEYPFDLHEDQIDPAPLWQAMLADWQAGTGLPRLSARFHNSVARLSLDVCRQVRTELGCQTVALSGGVWQNMFLLQRVIDALQNNGFRVLIHQRVPANDGCIALGQVMVAAYSGG
jgi:hydrogenase maturation protein HypF